MQKATRTFWGATLLTWILLTTFCFSADAPATGPKPSTETPQNPTGLRVQIDLSVHQETSGIYIDITANLPEATRIMVRITDDRGSIYHPGKPLARFRTTLSHEGRARLGPLKNGPKNYPHGEYTIRAWTLPLPRQPVAVQQFIRRQGGLSGKFVFNEQVWVEETFAIVGRDKW